MLQERIDLSLIISLLVQHSPGLSHTRVITSLLDEYYRCYAGGDPALLCRVAKGTQALPEGPREFLTSSAGFCALLTALSNPPLSSIADITRIAEILAEQFYIDDDLSEAARDEILCSSNAVTFDPAFDSCCFIAKCVQFACNRRFYPRHKDGRSSYYDTY